MSVETNLRPVGARRERPVRPSVSQRRVVVVGEALSPNLGDRVIADCLRHIVASAVPDAIVESLDLSQRTSENAQHVQANGLVGSVQTILNGRLVNSAISRGILSVSTRNYISWRANRRRRRRWLREVFSGAEHVLIGGGQLLADNDLDFPLKILDVAEVAASLNIRWSYVGCGVGNSWSSYARHLFSRAVRGCTGITVRDAESAARLRRWIPELDARLCTTFDLALNCAEVYDIQPRAKTAVGLGVTAPSILRRHAAEASSQLSNDAVYRFWVEGARRLIASGYKVCLFTNGHEADQKFAEQVREGLSGDVQLKSRPVSARQLIEMISSFSSVIAHRLHSCVIARALSVPVVGLVWDDKISHFFDQCPDVGFCLSTEGSSWNQIEQLLAATPKKNESALAQMVHANKSAVARLLTAHC